MKIYSPISFSTVGAPHLSAGICESYSYKNAIQTYEIQGEEDLAGIILHGKKGEISFSTTPAATVTALGVRAGSELTISGLSTGKIICTKSGAKWQRGQPMVFDIAATHFPHLEADGTGTITPATITLADGTESGSLTLPTDKVWFGTRGLTYEGGIVQSCGIEETIQIQEEPDGATGNITGIAIHGYKATCQMEILTSAALPEEGTSLVAFGTYRITEATENWKRGSTRSISITGILIPGITT